MTNATTDTKSAALVRLTTAIQNYDWGKTGSTSLAARLAPGAVGQNFKLDERKHYAEIWMGTHPNGPSSLYDSPLMSLESLISQNPEQLLGKRTYQKWPSKPDVPFLFKILSIEKALPLQAHPDKALGERLRKERQDLAPDNNHKPEIAVSIGKEIDGGVWGAGVAFAGFVGFRPLEHIKRSLEGVEELRNAVGDANTVRAFVESPSKEGLKRVYAALLNNGAREKSNEHVRALAKRVREASGKGYAVEGLSEEQARLVDKVEKQYEGDVGVLATTFFMNFVKLRRGEAVWIGADEIHAYLEGDIIECMAISDNVLNAAFSPPEEVKQQVPIFLEMLTYTARDPSNWALPAKPYEHSKGGRTVAYDPPLDEFVVLGTHLSVGGGEGGAERTSERLAAVQGPTMGIVTKGVVEIKAGGESLRLTEGGVVYVVPGNEVNVKLVRDGEDGEGEVWWAVCLV